MQIQEEHEFDEYNNSQSIRTTPTNASTTPKHLHHHPPTPIINKNSSTKSNHKTKRSETEQKDGSVSCNKCRPYSRRDKSSSFHMIILPTTITT
jgi:hypothetical protein